MKYLPFENYTLSTPLSAEEAQARLLENLEPERNWTYIMKNKTNPYQGAIDTDGFTISRVIRYGNSFLPVINGSFGKDVNGSTIIHITMRINSFVLLFMIIWFSGILLACSAPVVALLSRSPGKAFPPLALAPFAMLLLGYGLIMTLFKFESTKSKEFLANLFRA